MTLITCPICKNNLNESAHLFPKEMRIGTRESFKYINCSYCQCLFINKVPENLEIYYRNYYTENKNFVSISPIKKLLWKLRSSLTLAGWYPIISVFRKNTILSWLNHLKINFSDPVLDVGCGNGDILFEFSKHGFSNLSGVDPYPPSKKSGIFCWKFYKGDIFTIDNKKFRLIMFNHSLEHIFNHYQMLEKAKELLYEEGTILVRMPVINKAFENYRENWVQLDAPRHLLIHSLKSFETLCKELNLVIYKVIFDSTEYQFMGSEQYKRDITHYAPNSYKVDSDNSIFTKKEIKKFKNLTTKFNNLGLGDQCAFFLKLS